jgi:hypothetical protein
MKLVAPATAFQLSFILPFWFSRVACRPVGAAGTAGGIVRLNAAVATLLSSMPLANARAFTVALAASVKAALYRVALDVGSAPLSV